MKKLAVMLFALMANCGFAIEAATDSLTYSYSSENLFHSKVINIYHLTDKDLNEIMQGNQPEIAVEFPAQTTLPIMALLTN